MYLKDVQERAQKALGKKRSREHDVVVGQPVTKGPNTKVKSPSSGVITTAATMKTEPLSFDCLIKEAPCDATVQTRACCLASATT